jgi:hypothetical protein
MKKLKNVFAHAMAIFFVLACETDNSQIRMDSALNRERKEALAEILVLANNVDFRNFILEASLKQKHGEYSVLFSEIGSFCKQNTHLLYAVPKLEKLRNSLIELSGGFEPHLFYPRAETIEEKSTLNGGGRSSQYSQAQPPVGVIDDGSGSSTPPGYTVDYNGTLVFYANITEDYAWENDVWVVGQQELLSSENMVPAPESLPPDAARINGEIENFFVVKVSDLGAIEPWILGKIEFRVDVYSASGGVIKDKFKPGKIKRKYLRNNQIYDGNYFLCNWNTSTVGQFMIEGWVEEDGGTTQTTITQNFPAPPSCPTCPSVNVTTTIKGYDDDLGRTMIQFTDEKSQWYPISYMSIKHK